MICISVKSLKMLMVLVRDLGLSELIHLRFLCLLLLEWPKPQKHRGIRGCDFCLKGKNPLWIIPRVVFLWVHSIAQLFLLYYIGFIHCLKGCFWSTTPNKSHAGNPGSALLLENDFKIDQESYFCSKKLNSFYNHELSWFHASTFTLMGQFY